MPYLIVSQGEIMLVNIYKNGLRIKSFKKQGRYNFAVLESNEMIKSSLLGKIKIECTDCLKLKEICWRKALLKKKYYCQSCLKKGEKNPFYGKEHTQENKDKQSKIMKGRYIGEKNPFYGKTHSDETKENISVLLKEWHKKNENPFLGKKHTKETISKIQLKNKVYYESLTAKDKEAISKKLSDVQKRLFLENPEKYSSLKRKAAIASAKSQKKYKMNNLEKKFLKMMQKENIHLEYSLILGTSQFDFGHKDSKTLIEIHGDYWHGNPKFYNKNQLNNIQKSKKEKDKTKRAWAESKGFNYVYFWEDDIKNNPEKVLKEVKDAIKI
tara:strand:- start:56 stop:1033 length:978 start_codon:yes stop_codon:yes gene_type:complete